MKKRKRKMCKNKGMNRRMRVSVFDGARRVSTRSKCNKTRFVVGMQEEGLGMRY
jgi:hypothetical protein